MLRSNTRGRSFFPLSTSLRRLHPLLPRFFQPSIMDPSSSPPPPSPSISERYDYNPTLRWNPEVEKYFVSAYGALRFAQISKALTHPSSYSCIRVNTLKSTTDTVIDKLGTIINERGLLMDMNHMKVSENDNEDATLSEPTFYSKRVDESSFEACNSVVNNNELVVKNSCLSKCQLPGLENVLFVKGSGPHTIQYHDSSSQPIKEIIVSRKCGEAVLRGAQIYVPGVLACSSHVEKGDAVAVSVAVEQPVSENGFSVGITRGIILNGSEMDPQYCERNGLYIGRGVSMLSRAGMFRASEGVAVQMTERVYKLPSFNDVLEGEIFLQNLPSIVAARVLDPQAGERILDMCAAPGGKTTAIAILMKDQGEVIAIDRSHNKVMDILNLASEMDLNCIRAFRLDALKAVCKTNNILHSDSNKASVGNLIETSDCFIDAKGSLQDAATAEKTHARKKSRARNGPGRNNCKGCRVENSKGFLPDSFDRVLLDAPCSALGLRPRLFAGEETIKSLVNHANYQRRMFDQAVQLVRSGGILVYSTSKAGVTVGALFLLGSLIVDHLLNTELRCTINPGENEALVRYALDTYKFLSLAPQHPRIGGPGLVGHSKRLGGNYEEWLSPSEAELVQRFDPSSPLDTIGFFIAKFSVGPKDLLAQERL